MADLLIAQKVRKEFGGLVAVNDVDFTVPERKIVSLIGPNGAGKTTFFNMLTGVYKPTAGAIEFDGHDITNKPPHAVGARCSSTATCAAGPRPRPGAFRTENSGSSRWPARSRPSRSSSSSTSRPR